MRLNSQSESDNFGGDLTAQRFFTIFSTQDGLSWYYNIVLLWITKKEKNSLPIQSWVNYCAFGDAVWFFKYMRLYSQSESGREEWEADGGFKSTLGGIPQAVPD